MFQAIRNNMTLAFRIFILKDTYYYILKTLFILRAS